MNIHAMDEIKYKEIVFMVWMIMVFIQIGNPPYHGSADSHFLQSPPL
jgi:hypothetical protein